MQLIVNELLGTGLTQQELADMVPCAQSTINAFVNGKRGARVSLAIGHRLLELHSERVLRRSPGRRSTDKKRS